MHTTAFNDNTYSHCFSFATVAMLFCSALLSLYSYDAVEQCYNKGQLITAPPQYRGFTSTASLRHNHSPSTTYGSTHMATPKGMCSTAPYSIGFSPCRVTGVLLVSPKSATSTWKPSARVLTPI